MILSLQSSQCQFGGARSTSLTEEQKTAMTEILEKYDPENMTEEDRAAMIQEFREAGIPRSRDGMQLMKEAGFGPPEGGPPPGGMRGPMAGTGPSEDVKTQLLDLIERAQAGEVTDEELQSELAQLAEMMASTSGMLINQSA